MSGRGAFARAALLGCAMLLGAAWADTVKMKNGLLLEGKVHRETPEFVILLVYNESGRIRIPRKQIKKIEYDFASRLEEIEEDDYRGQYELGRWAFSKGMYPEAIQQFEKVKGKQGAGKELYKLLGQAYDKRGQLDKAYAAYKNYLLSNPDPKIKQRAGALAKELGVKKATGTKPPPAKPKVVDGFEGSFRWRAEKWKNANPCVVRPYVDKDTGNKMIVVQMQKGSRDKSAFTGSGRPLNLSESKELIFKAFHSGKTAVRLAVALVNKKGEYYETKQIPIPPNSWVNQVVPITGKVFKSTRNNYLAFNDELGGRDNIARLHFLIYGQRAVTLYLDYIFFR